MKTLNNLPLQLKAILLTGLFTYMILEYGFSEFF